MIARDPVAWLLAVALLLLPACGSPGDGVQATPDAPSSEVVLDADGPGDAGVDGEREADADAAWDSVEDAGAIADPPPPPDVDAGPGDTDGSSDGGDADPDDGGSPDADSLPEVGPDVPDGSLDVGDADDGHVEDEGPMLTPEPEPFPESVLDCDAGDAAWVARALESVLGRKPYGVNEIAVWTRLVEQEGRQVALEAMMSDEAYVDRWADFFMDALRVNRVDDKAHGACYGQAAKAPDDGALAAFVRDNAPTVNGGPGGFRMTDLLESALRLDDISPVYRAHLFAMLEKPVVGANVGNLEMESARRNDFGEAFDAAYLHRQKSCMGCHNSTFSVTGSPDPALDRTWEIPGHFEAAVFEFPSGRPEVEVRAMLRRLGVYTDAPSGIRPWGWSVECGRFVAQAEIAEDPLEVQAYFIEERGLTANVWQLEADLRAGFAGLWEDGVGRDPETLEVDGREAFAWLVSTHVANQVWRELTGYSLTIANYFPRNRNQRDVLWEMSERFVEEGFSVRALVRQAVLDPRFNQLPPEAGCGAQDGYYMRPTFDPWTVHEDDPTLQGNGVGDLVARRTARNLMRSVSEALSWPHMARFPGTHDIAFQAAIGAFVKDARPGFRGTDLQGLLAWEDRFAGCRSPEGKAPGPGCEAGSAAGCGGCACEDCVCGEDSYCCDTAWDDICAQKCEELCGGCGPVTDPEEMDFVDRIVFAATAAPAEGVGEPTVGDAIRALKDRLIQEPTVGDDEAPLVEALLGVSLGAPAAEVEDLGERLRRLCGALLESPQFLLSGGAAPETLEPPDLAVAGQGFADQCARIAELWADEGYVVACGDGSVTVEESVEP